MSISPAKLITRAPSNYKSKHTLPIPTFSSDALCTALAKLEKQTEHPIGTIETSPTSTSLVVPQNNIYSEGQVSKYIYRVLPDWVGSTLLVIISNLLTVPVTAQILRHQPFGIAEFPKGLDQF